MEIVHCKDCKWYSINNKEVYVGYCTCPDVCIAKYTSPMLPRKDSDFCSYGLKMDIGKETR